MRSFGNIGWNPKHIVILPTLDGITIEGPSTVSEGTTAQYVCTANYSDDTHVNVSPVWSESSEYASIDTSGLLTAGFVTKNQYVMVFATYGGEMGMLAVEILNDAVTLNSITIEGPSSVHDYTETQYLCRANWSDGSHTYISPVWSDNSSYATITSAGVLQAGVPQHVTQTENVIITAIYGGKADTHTITIYNVV